jgi:hypothetical protein
MRPAGVPWPVARASVPRAPGAFPHFVAGEKGPSLRRVDASVAMGVARLSRGVLGGGYALRLRARAARELGPAAERRSQ